MLKWDKTEPVVLEFATIICKLVAKQSWVVCNGISSQFRVSFDRPDLLDGSIHYCFVIGSSSFQDEFFYVFRQLADRSPEEICGLLLPDCADPEDPNQSGWTVALPPRPTIEKSSKSKDFRGLDQKRENIFLTSNQCQLRCDSAKAFPTASSSAPVDRYSRGSGVRARFGSRMRSAYLLQEELRCEAQDFTERINEISIS